MMHKHHSNVCKSRLCLATESTNLAHVRAIVIAALQQQCLQMELIFWITLIAICVQKIFIWNVQ
jgi:hypothetical protein